MNYWKRYINFNIGDKEYKSPLELKFESFFNMKGGAETTAYIYNPSEELIANAEPKAKESKEIVINAGFENDYGVCVIGEIYAFSVIKSGVDRFIEMKIGDSTKEMTNTRVSRTWQNNVKASAVVNDLVNMFQLDKGKIEVGIDKTYAQGFSFNCKLKRALKQMARETESDFFLRNGRIYFQSKKDEGIKTGIMLSPTTGLLNKPEKVLLGTIQGWNIKSLFNYKIGSGEFISIESSSFSGDSKVIRGRHYYTDKEAYTEIEVIKV